MKNKTSVLLFFLLILLWGLNSLAGVFDLYYVFNWYDVMMHTLGGVILGLMAIMLIRRFQTLSQFSILKKVIFIIMSGIIGGILWEVFEYFQDVYLQTAMQVSLRDTMSDLVCDTIGAGIVAVVYWWNKKL